MTGDRFFDLVITAYHITDWVKNDASIPAAAKNDIASMYENKYVALCRDIANASKHFELRDDYKNRTTESAEARRGFGCGRFGKGGFGVGEDSICIRCNDGTQMNALELAHGALDAWVSFFDSHVTT